MNRTPLARKVVAVAGASLATATLLLAIPVLNGALREGASSASASSRPKVDAVTVDLDDSAPDRRPRKEETARHDAVKTERTKAAKAAAPPPAPIKLDLATAPTDPLAGLDSAPAPRFREGGFNSSLRDPGTTLSRDLTPPARPRESGPLELADVDREPRRKACPSPQYPPAAQRRGVEGSATLSFVITAEGSVTDIQILSTDGAAEFGEAAREAVASWSFEPAQKRGEAVACRKKQTIRFRLER